MREKAIGSTALFWRWPVSQLVRLLPNPAMTAAGVWSSARTEAPASPGFAMVCRSLPAIVPRRASCAVQVANALDFGYANMHSYVSFDSRPCCLQNFFGTRAFPYAQ
jgi:hypothetical protein